MQKSLFKLQFYRNFPGPSDVTEEEKKLLTEKYRDPTRPGMINYLNLHHDVVAVAEFMRKDAEVPAIKQTDIDRVPLLVSQFLLMSCCFSELLFYMMDTLSS
jgi:hypothetical protein